MDTHNLFLLADRACRANNFFEAEIYYSRILEINPYQPLALFGKSYSIGMQAIPSNTRFREILLYQSEYMNTYNNIMMSHKKFEILTSIGLDWDPPLKTIFDRFIKLSQHIFNLGKSFPSKYGDINEKVNASYLSLLIMNNAYFFIPSDIFSKEIQKNEVIKYLKELINNFFHLVNSQYQISTFNGVLNYILWTLNQYNLHDILNNDKEIRMKIQYISENLK